MKKNYYAKLEAETFYHIYNIGNNGIDIFFNLENYKYFIRKFDEYFSDFIEVFAFCLLPNHFHFLIRLKKAETIFRNTKKLKSFEKFLCKITDNNTTTEAADLPSLNNFVSLIVTEQFRRFFMAYSKAINKQQNRHGSLFTKKFKRIKIDSINYLKELVYYIHNNPEHHNIYNNFKTYNWSSYNRILSSRKSKLQKSEVISWFEDKENYIYCHNKKHETSFFGDIED